MAVMGAAPNVDLQGKGLMKPCPYKQKIAVYFDDLQCSNGSVKSQVKRRRRRVLHKSKQKGVTSPFNLRALDCEMGKSKYIIPQSCHQRNLFIISRQRKKMSARICEGEMNGDFQVTESFIEFQ